MIRVLVVDDHPALRAGVTGLLRGEPGLVPVAVAGDAADALDAAARSRPDIALIDYSLADSDGLSLCLSLKSLPAPPRVLMYSAFAGEELAVAARVAGGDGLVDKAAPPADLFDALRAAARGRGPMVTPPLDAQRRIAERLECHDHAVFAMSLQGTSHADIARALQLRPEDVRDRLARLLASLRAIVNSHPRFEP